MNRRKPYITRDGETRLQPHRGGWPGPRKVDVTFGVDESVLAAVDALAASQGIARAVVLRRFVDGGLSAPDGIIESTTHHHRNGDDSSDGGGRQWATNGTSGAVGRGAVMDGSTATETRQSRANVADRTLSAEPTTSRGTSTVTATPIDRLGLLLDELTPAERDGLSTFLRRLADNPKGPTRVRTFFRRMADIARTTIPEAAR